MAPRKQAKLFSNQASNAVLVSNLWTASGLRSASGERHGWIYLGYTMYGSLEPRFCPGGFRPHTFQLLSQTGFRRTSGGTTTHTFGRLAYAVK